MTGKSHKGVIFHLFGSSLIKAMHIKNCVVGDVLDVITCAKFQNDFSRVVTT